MAYHEFHLDDVGTAFVFALGAVVLLFFSGYVMTSAVRSEERRKQVPSYLLLGRTFVDALFAILVYVNFILSEVNEKWLDDRCGVMSMFMLWVFLISCGYFGAICGDIRHTIVNPFNRPVSNTWWIHLVCWIVSLVLVLFFSVSKGELFAWGYREDYQMCFIRWTPYFNGYNIVLLYVPICAVNVLGCVVSFWSFQQLQQKVLDATFECRWLVLRRQLFITLCYTFSYVLSFCFWLPMVIPAFYAKNEPTRATFQPYCTLCIVLAQLLGDAMSWYYSNYFSNSGTTRSLKILKFFGLLGETVANTIGIEINASMSQKRYASMVAHHKSPRNKNDLKENLISTADQRGGIAKDDEDRLDALESGGSARAGPSESPDALAPQDEEALLEEERARLRALQASQAQDLSDALRREVVAYMTHGIAQSLVSASVETRDYLDRGGRDRIDPDARDSDISAVSGASEPSGAPAMTRDAVAINRNEEMSPANANDPIIASDAPGAAGAAGGAGAGGARGAAAAAAGVEDVLEPDVYGIHSSRLFAQSLDFPPSPTHPLRDAQTRFSIAKQYSTEFTQDEVAQAEQIGHKAGENNLFVRTLNTIAARENNVFVDYSPHVFRFLRTRVYGISEREYYESIAACFANNIDSHIKSHFSEGASGAFFFFTTDQKYIIKTVTAEEAGLLLNVLKSYVKFYRGNEASFLNKFYGLYCLQYFEKIYFVVLNNLLVPNEKPQETYDIKGSWVDRSTKYHVESGKLMKDTDLHKTLSLTKEQARQCYAQLSRDTAWLASVGIMDYSLLLGIYYMKIESKHIRHREVSVDSKDAEESEDVDDVKFEYPADLALVVKAAERSDSISKKLKRPKSYSYHKGMSKVGHHRGRVMAHKMEGPCVYYFGIIDMLQAWNKTKKWERFFKVWILCKDGKGVSCVEPNFYQQRFMKRMCDLNIRPV